MIETLDEPIPAPERLSFMTLRKIYMGMKRNLSRKLSSAEPKTAQNTWVLAMNVLPLYFVLFDFPFS